MSQPRRGYAALTAVVLEVTNNVLLFGTPAIQKFDDLSNLAPSPSRNFILLLLIPGVGEEAEKGRSIAVLRPFAMGRARRL